MAKDIQKYFIAIVPEGEIQEMVTGIKYQLRDEFGLKYALKSPGHITLKMPFLWNAIKEDLLIKKLKTFFLSKSGFPIALDGFGRFGKRVIYVKVRRSDFLDAIQNDLNIFCKMSLNLNQELSDRSYTPHMTLAFKDVKSQIFEDYWRFLNFYSFDYECEVSKISLLKKLDGKWAVIHDFRLDN